MQRPFSVNIKISHSTGAGHGAPVLSRSAAYALKVKNSTDLARYFLDGA